MFKLSPEGQNFVKKELARYESIDSAIIPCLYLVQKENGGWVSDDSIAHLSELMNIPFARIHEVCTFYTMFNRKPIGQHHVQVCTNISCAMNGGRELIEHLCEHFKTAEGEVSKDGRFTFSRVECLGSCGTAPMMQVDDNYYENLTPQGATTLLEKME